ncbi:SCO family protein [Paenibacillus radicis (ex Xue et al. 2023)]|uniref:SCO family protein n=1 Tax=Paenibacillus radicis (ex Xue et al. 2023) TaxID=2972489 RepID=A0ABT1YAK0_9BACL|nr:SCO family protein [Paenibacillus radicis (ex Xue et al. 2023)]MCR8629922.1 SCO family protein [Paenibacillus radicis (ex Xue et al. 2023)]
MNTNAQSNWFKIVVIVLLLAMIGVFGYMMLKGKDTKIGVIKPAPDFKLENIDGKKVGLADLSGKAKLVYFFYSTCPDVCSPTTYTISKIQDSLVKKGVFGDKTAIVSITFDPTKDTTEQLKEFSGRFHADPKGWYFLRGGEAESMQLAEKFGVTVLKDKQGGTFTHNNVILLVDKKGDLRTYYVGSDPNLDVEKIAQDMIQLTKE